MTNATLQRLLESFERKAQTALANRDGCKPLSETWSFFDGDFTAYSICAEEVRKAINGLEGGRAE